MTTTETRRKWFHCPDCPEKYLRPQGLAVHRLKAHGTLGTSKSSLSKYAAAQKAKSNMSEESSATLTSSTTLTPETFPLPPSSDETPGIAPSDATQFICSECSLPFRTASLLDIHRRFVHKPQPKKNTQASKVAPTFACHLCEASFLHQKALAIHIGRIHKEPQITQGNPLQLLKGATNGHAAISLPIQSESQSYSHPNEDEIVAFTIGKIESLVEGLARTHDIPYRQFAQRVAESFRMATRR